MNEILNKLIQFQQEHPDIYIGGSTALILQNAIPFRIPKDIDIITPKKVHIYTIFNIQKEAHLRIKRCKHNDLYYDLHFNPNAEYIEYNFNGDILKLSPVNEIMQWKYKNTYLDKHNNDIEQYDKIR